MTEYDIDTLQRFFDRDTYADLLDLLVDLVSGDYSLKNLKMDIDDYLESVEPLPDGQHEIDYDGELND